MKITAIIPIKDHSSRVPGKNYRLLNGKPLYWYILDTLSNCPFVDQIVVDTDSDRIKTGITKHYPHVIIYERPTELCGDHVSTNKLLLNVVKTLDLDSELFIHTHTTNPLLKSNTITEAIKTYLYKKDKYDSLFTVNKWQTRLYNNDGSAVNHDPENLIPTQELTPLYEENSVFYLVPRETLFKLGRRIGNKPLLFEINRLEAQDIDWEHDFELTEHIVRWIESKEIRRTIVITGSSGGIGAELCKRFKTDGWNVIGIDLIKPDDTMYIDNFVKGSVADQSVGDQVLDITDRVDCLVNCAAYQLNKLLIDTEEDEWDKVIGCNLKGAYLLSRTLFPKLKEVGGSVINVSSVHSICTSERIAAYATSKAGLMGMTRAMALEFGQDGVRVNAVIPGAIDTPMLRAGFERGHTVGGSIDQVMKRFADKHPIKRVGEVTDVAELVKFLADKRKSGFIIGQGIVVDGGVTVKLSTE